MREFLHRQYLTRAGDRATAPPTFEDDGALGPYPDKLMFEGDPAIGARLYQQACDHCHGEGKVYESAGGDLVADLPRFFEVLTHGTEQSKQPYMPMFTSERLSRQQIADIQAYLEQQ
jgi:mono/diheme cytochrome c family protein